MIFRHVFLLCLGLYLVLIFPFTSYLKNRPIEIKLGYMPEAKALKLVTADQRYAVASWSVFKVLFYFGQLLETVKDDQKFIVPPEYFNMFRRLQTALKLDPYNKDAYYFAQAAFTWELGRFKEVNNLLEYGMKYRSWDYQLPFFAGFNAAYFMKDYGKAAMYMKKAAEISGEPLFATLAARYFNEAGQGELGVVFLETMEKGERDNKVKKIYETRKRALLAAKEINAAVEGFKLRYHRPPDNLNDLLAKGLLLKIPADPYGGTFYLDKDGKAESTSKFAFGGQGK